MEEGDFVYQSEQELFLVVADESDESYTFAVHGWREIDKDRLEEYLENGDMLHRSEDVERVIEEGDSDVTKERFERLQEMLFDIYEESSLEDDGVHEEFVLDDT